VLEIGLTVEDREALYHKLDARIDQMIANGLLDEVRGLYEAGYDWRLPSMTGLGYAQLGMVLRGETTLDEAVIAFKRDTRSFVRRQYTWFRRHGQPHWFEAPSTAEILHLIDHWLSGQER